MIVAVEKGDLRSTHQKGTKGMRDQRLRETQWQANRQLQARPAHGLLDKPSLDRVKGSDKPTINTVGFILLGHCGLWFSKGA